MYPATDNYVETYRENGYVILPGFITAREVGSLLQVLEKNGAPDYSVLPHLLAIPGITALLQSPRMLAIVEAVIGNNAQLANSIILDKTKDNNWGLDWHQDTKVAVNQRIEIPGYTNWTVEQGIHHVVLPAGLYDRKLYMRLHLDDCDSSNGAIWMLPGTHKLGIVPQSEIQAVVTGIPIQQCEVKSGDVMLMHPLLLHKSPYSLSAAGRRILQADYTTITAENGLEWK